MPDPSALPIEPLAPSLAVLALERLCRVRTGEPVGVDGLAVLPLYATAGPQRPREHVTLAEAPGVTIRELAGSRVPELEIENPLDVAVLGLEGVLLRGGLQNRMNLRTWLIGPKRRARIPVACVQRGRWRVEESLGFHAAPMIAPAHLKAVARGRSSEQAQREVWAQVHEVLHEHHADDGSSDLCAGFAKAAGREDVGALERELNERLDGACGYVVTRRGSLASLELFGHREDFDVLRAGHARTLALELAGARAREGSDDFYGYDAHRERDLLARVRLLLAGHPHARAGIDRGHELLARSYDGWTVTGFFHEDEMLALSAARRRRERRARGDFVECD